MVFTYVFSSVGVCLVAHYCGGSLEKISLFSKPNSCCGGEEDEADDCCKNDSKHIVFQKDFTFYKVVADSKAPVRDLFLIEKDGLTGFSFNGLTYSQFSGTKKVRPPNLMQESIVLSSVLRI